MLMEISAKKYKKVPYGVRDFEKIVSEGYYYTDKTLFIRNILEQGGEVTLIPRPRRFGKTINMTMLKSFFEKSDPSKAELFDTLAIKNYPDIMAHQGQYPVIFLTFRGVRIKLGWVL